MWMLRAHVAQRRSKRSSVNLEARMADVLAISARRAAVEIAAQPLIVFVAHAWGGPVRRNRKLLPKSYSQIKLNVTVPLAGCA
jgi:hypothetical protein